LYAQNAPALITPKNLVDLAGLASKYHCIDLAKICGTLARRALRDAKLLGGSRPTVPALLVRFTILLPTFFDKKNKKQVLGQRTSNPAILAEVLKKGFGSFAPPAPPLTPNPARYGAYACPVHGEPLPCYFGCPAPGLAAANAAAAAVAAPVFDDAARAQLALLNGSTLVRLLENVMRPPPAIAKK
jgi:hypothetical protein